jgi:putative transposase
MPLKYKTCKRHNEPGHAHALTFSCYHSQPLLEDDRIKEFFVQAIAAARTRHDFALLAYVVMPTHAHLLVQPRRGDYSISTILAAIKRPTAYHARLLILSELPSFWQAGGGFDRNIITPEAMINEADYLHNNPVRARLCSVPSEWRYSSAAWYEGRREGVPISVDSIETH